MKKPDKSNNLLSSADFFQNQLFRIILSGIPSECQTVWIQIKPDIMSGLIWIQTVCKGYQQTILVSHLLDTSQKSNTGMYFDCSEINPYSANHDCSRLQFCDIFLNFQKKIRHDISWELSAGRWFTWNFMPYLFIFGKATKFKKFRLLQIIGGALWDYFSIFSFWYFLKNFFFISAKRLK